MTSSTDHSIRATLQSVSENFVALQAQAPLIARAAAMVSDALAGGGKIMLCGNGGSAADSQHIAAELVGRFERERTALAAVALTVDTSALTAIANDYGFDKVYARQVQALGRRGDVLMALSTSGNSGNVLEAVDAANSLGVRCIGLTGAGGGRLADRCELTIAVPSTVTARIQEMHIAIGHIICGLVETSRQSP